MAESDEAEVFCPRCGYNQRGLPQPRCPECGLAFDADAWRAGVLRDNVPSPLDRCDPWQPHQVLLLTLGDLLRGLRSPRRLLMTLDVNGSLKRAPLMLIVGSGWLYLLITLLIAGAMLVHVGVSPAAALRSAALFWAPRALIVALAAAALTFGWVSMPSVIRIAQPEARHYVRLLCWWLPTAAAYVAFPLGALLLIVPEFAFGLPYVFPMLTGFPAVVALRGRNRRASKTRADWRVITAVWCAVGWLTGTTWLASRLLPDTLEPPAWIFF